VQQQQCAVEQAHLAKLFCVLSGVCTGSIHKSNNGKAKMVCMLHEAQGLAVAVWLRHSKVSVDIFLHTLAQSAHGDSGVPSA